MSFPASCFAGLPSQCCLEGPRLTSSPASPLQVLRVWGGGGGGWGWRVQRRWRPRRRRWLQGREKQEPQQEQEVCYDCSLPVGLVGPWVMPLMCEFLQFLLDLCSPVRRGSPPGRRSRSPVRRSRSPVYDRKRSVRWVGVLHTCMPAPAFDRRVPKPAATPMCALAAPGAASRQPLPGAAAGAAAQPHAGAPHAGAHPRRQPGATKPCSP